LGHQRFLGLDSINHSNERDVGVGFPGQPCRLETPDLAAERAKQESYQIPKVNGATVTIYNDEWNYWIVGKVTLENV
jgi:hypothetical protein